MSHLLNKMPTHNFTIENPELNNYTCNQNVLIKRRFLPNLNRYEVREKPPQEAPHSTEWYPYVNSYYQYGEDYDAVTRVPHLLYEKNSQLSLNSSVSTENAKPTPRPAENFKDAYNEQFAQHQFLRKKPTSFVILGKPELGEQLLGKLLADHWNSVYIHPEALIQEEIDAGTRAGICMEYNLRSGRAISVDVVMRLLQKKITHVSIKNRGFVVCGFPLVSNTLFSEDPISSESAVFTVHDIFEEIFDSVLDNKRMFEDVKNVSPAGSVEDGYSEIENDNQSNASVYDHVSTDTKSEICYDSHLHADQKDQMNFLFSLCEEHDYVIIYLKCANEEVVNLRMDNRVDAVNFHLMNLQHEKVHFRGFEMNEDRGFFLGRKMLKPQRDFPVNVNAQLDKYRFESQTVIEKYILLHNPEYVIKLDARLAPERMFHNLKLRLRILPLSQSLIPELLVDRFVEDMDMESPRVSPKIKYADMTPKEWFDDLHARKIAGRLFKWALSDWEYLCPVAMFEGRYLQGNPEYAVHFMNKIYFLSGEEAYEKFNNNPRPYLLPPFPRPRCRVFIVGPPVSGKTAVAQVLSHVLQGVILDPETMLKRYLAERRDELVTLTKAKIVNDALDILRRERQEEIAKLEIKRQNMIDKFLADAIKTINKYLECRNILNTVAVELQMTSLPMPSGLNKTQEYAECEDALPGLEVKIRKLGLSHEDIDMLQRIQLDNTLLNDFLPERLLQPVPIASESASINIHHPFVEEYSKKAMQEAENELSGNSTNIGNTCESFLQGIRSAEESGSGWIIDGFPPNVQLLEMLSAEHIADLIFILSDRSIGMEFLKRRHLSKDANIISDLAAFFKERGFDEIAHKIELSSRPAGSSYAIMDYLHEKVEGDEPYQVACDKHGKVIGEFLEFLRDNDVPFVEILVTDKSIEGAASEVLTHLGEQFNATPTIFTGDDRREEMDDYGELQVEDEELGEESEDKPSDQYFAENRRIGITGKFCPVALKHFNVLWQGKEANAAKYSNELYFFSSPDAMDEFLRIPKRILENFKAGPPSPLPPARICVVGTYKVGKTTLAQALSKRLGLYYGDFDVLLHRSITDEEMLHGYFESDQPVPDKKLQSILFPFWREEPQKTVGFVLDGFPRRPSDIDFMCRHVLIPDVIIELTCPDYILQERLLDIFLNEWHVQMNLMKQKQQEENMRIYEEWKVARMARLEELILLKRDERYAAKRRSKEEVLRVTEFDEDGEGQWNDEGPRTSLDVIREAEELAYDSESDGSNSLVSYTSIEEQDDLREIEHILDDELPEPGFHVNGETVQIATERIQRDVDECIAREFTFLIPMKEHCDTELIPWNSIAANSDVLNIYNQAARLVLPFKFRNPSMFERVYDVSIELAEKLLEQGYYFLSRFGKTCPVQMFEKDNYLQLFLAAESKFQLFPLIHKSYIYFIAGAEKREMFKQNVLKYVNQYYNQLPMIQLRVSIMGPPRCGKTTLSERMQYEYGLKHISIGMAVEFVLKHLSKSKLAQKVEEELRGGDYLSDSLVISCVEAMSFEDKSLAMGFVMDGFPKNINQVKELAKLNMLQHLILDLNTDLDYIFTYMDVNENTHRPEYSKKFIAHRFGIWSECEASDRKWIEKEYQNVARVKIDPSKWKFWKNASNLLLAVVSEIKYYYSNKDRDVPLRIANMLVSPLEFLQRKSRFKNYCPCCLFHDNTLTNGNNPPDRTGLLQYKEYYYWLCNEHIEDFIDNPKDFLDPNVRHSLPIALPERIRIDSAPENVYENGICVICLENNKPERVFNEGLLDYAARYSDTVYLFDTEECLDQFLCKPNKYCSVSINFRGKSYSSLEMSELPTLGFLEQFGANLVVKAVTEVNSSRPFITGLDVRTSALIHLALILKIRNPNTPAQFLPVYKSVLERLLNQRCDLVRCLEDLKSTINPYLHYQEPLPVFQREGFKRSLSTIDEVATLSASSNLEVSSTTDAFPTVSATSTETAVAAVLDDVLDQVTY